MAKTLTIGKMRSIAAFQRNSPSPLGAGQQDEYNTFLRTRGILRKDNGSRGLDFALLATEDTYTLICRFQLNLEIELASNTKVIVDGQLFTIASWEKIDQIRHLYKFKLNTQVRS